MRKPLSYALIPLMSAGTALAQTDDWRTDIGWDDLQDWASVNGVGLVDTSSVSVAITEAAQGSNSTIYCPNPSYSEFAGKTINDVTGNTVSYSSHATTSVGRFFFGNSSSLSPANNIDCYEVDDFVSRIQNLNHDSWTPRVMSHAYVSTGTLDEPTTTAVSAHIDKTTTDSDLLHVVGMSNSTGAALPQIWSHSYNSISVGVSDGTHSYGTITNDYEGAGRQKPEVVNPQSTTSSATGATSSVATLLNALGASHTGNANASKALTIKSCILAGANKLSVADWDNTSTRPLDEVFGAGETNIFYSYRILSKTEVIANSVTHADLYGWDYHTATDASDIVYHFTIPDYASSASISANLSWHRAASTKGVGRNRTFSYDELANFSLTLKHKNGADIFTSNSPVDNLEHIWLQDLQPGDYSLIVNKSSGAVTDYALAWRVDIETNSSPSTFVQAASENQLGFTDLAPSHSYFLERSSDLTTWTPISTLTSTASGTLNYNDPNSSLGNLVFYRLRYFSP